MTAQQHSSQDRAPTYSDEQLQALQRNTFQYFWQETNPSNGLIADNTAAADVPASIAGVGMALSSYPVAVERGFATRAQAVQRALTTLRFFSNAPHGAMPDATGHRGFFYHFLDVSTGRRAWRSELSTIDTAILIAGALTAAAYFDRSTDDEREVRTLADSLYRRVDWQWAQGGQATVSHGWKPETGFIRYRWQGYNEALILYCSAGSSSTRCPGRATWPGPRRIAGRLCGHEFLFGASLFMHQLSHIWIDFQAVQMSSCVATASTTSTAAAHGCNQRYRSVPKASAAIAGTPGITAVTAPVRLCGGSAGDAALSRVCCPACPGPDDGTLAVGGCRVAAPGF